MAGNWFQQKGLSGVSTKTIDPLAVQYLQNPNYVGLASDKVGFVQDLLTYMFPCRVVSEFNLNATYANGTAGVGATLTNAGAQAHLILDGVSVSVNDRVLVVGQNTALQNGIYVVTNTGSPSTNWVLTRATDWNDPVQMRPGRSIPIVEGNSLASSVYVMLNPQPATIGTDPIDFFSMLELALAALNAYLPLSGGTMTGNLLLSSDATLPTQAVTLEQLNAVAAGLVVKLACYAATTANLNATFAHVDAGVGSTLTNAGALAAFSVDGTSPPLNARILVKDETTTAQNGIYTLTTVGSGAVAWVLTRATDYDTTAEVVPGTIAVVNNGTVNANSSWIETATVNTMDTDPILFTMFTANPNSFLKVANNLSDLASVPTAVSNLGLVIGTNVEAWSAVLDAVAAGTYTGSTSITTLGTIATGTWHGTAVGAIYGGTGFSTYTLGDTLYSDATNSLAKLTGNTASTIKYLSQTGTGVVSAAPVWSTISGGDITGAALTKTDDTNVTLTLGGSPSTALLRAASLTLGWAGQLAVSRGGTGLGSVTAHNLVIGAGTSALTLLAPSATSGIALVSQGASADPAYGTVVIAGGGTNITTYTLGDTLYSDATNSLAKLAGNTTAVKQYLSQTGTGTVSAAPAWATISGGDITGAALTKTDDTNVTLTLGGSPSTALLRAASLTLGWTGQLSVPRGGTGIATTTAYGVLTGGTTATGAFQNAGTGATGTMFQGAGSAALPTWSTSTWPATTTINELLYSSAANTVGGLATVNNAALATTAAGVPTWRALTDGQLLIGSSIGAPLAATLTQGTGITITNGHNTITIAATNTGTVTSITAGTGLTGGTITTSGTIALSVPVSLANGGSNADLSAAVSNGGIVWTNATQMQVLAGTSTARQMLQSGATATPAWSTTTWPATTTANRILYSSANNTISEITSANNGVVQTDGSGVPSVAALDLTSAKATAAFTDISGTVTVNGFSGTPTVVFRQCVIGKIVHIEFNISGTSNSTSFTVTGLPKASLNAWTLVFFIANNGANAISIGSMSASGTTITFSPTVNSATWTASGNKVAIGNFFYEST